jgi:proline racemase
VLLETGMLPMTEPVTRLTLESPAGLIEVECACRDGKVERVTLVNQPAFVYHTAVPLEVEALGTLTVDIAYGGMTYVVVDAEAAGVALEPTEEAALAELGQRIKRAGAEQYDVEHPENPLIPGITQTLFAGPLIDEGDAIRSRNAVIVSPGRLDRSPCGTGTSARLAVLHARGELAPGQVFRHESVIGTQFDSRVVGTTTVGGYDAVVPSVSGRAWLTSFNQLVLDPSDPFQEGFVVGRPWEVAYA